MKETRFHIAIRWIVTGCSAGIGVAIALLVERILIFYGIISPLPQLMNILWISATPVVFAVIGWFISPWLIRQVGWLIDESEQHLSNMPVAQVVTTAVGLGFGLIIALLLSLPFRVLLPDAVWAGLSVLLYVIFGAIGAGYAMRRWRDLPWFTRRDRKADPPPISYINTTEKILDTSVIIDGRIFDICKTGFLEGMLVIPHFVLAELRHIADSADAMRRARGRRGLDVLARIQKELDVPLRIDDTDFEDIHEVDVKLLRLAQKTGATVVTNDFNLNKVAGVTGMRVLNINDLANALRPMLIPGEEMSLQIVREGKEAGQGVGYLADGTMIVVDNARHLIGEMTEVVVTTTFQTSAGRMIFARLKTPQTIRYAKPAMELHHAQPYGIIKN